MRNTDGTYCYEYTLKDHLGNARVSIDDNAGVARVVQENEYYAFGLNRQKYLLGDKNNYLYNGKEQQETLTDEYDYGARFYDPVLGRWDGIDPLAEIARRFSPYVYGNNNPVRFIDPDGMAPQSFDQYTQEMDRELGINFPNFAQEDDKDKPKEKEQKENASQGGVPPTTGDYLLAKMYAHYQFSGGEPMTIDASTLDFGGTSQKELGITGMKKGETRDPVNLFNSGVNPLSLAFGKLKMTYLGNNQFSIADNKFDFDYQSGASNARNAGTLFGGVVNYNVVLSFLVKSPIPTLIPILFGGSYNVIFNGTVTIPR